MAKTESTLEKKLRAHLSMVVPEKRELAEAYIPNIAFMSQGLADLRQSVLENGFTEEYRNSETQYGTKKSSALSSYCQLIAAYNKTVQAFAALFPASEKSAVSGALAFDDFLGKASKAKAGR